MLLKSVLLPVFFPCKTSLKRVFLPHSHSNVSVSCWTAPRPHSHFNVLLPKFEPSLHHLSKFCYLVCVLLLLKINILVLHLQPAASTWTWRKFSLPLTRSRLRTLAPLLTPRCLPRCPPRCPPAFLITPRQTSSACRVSAATTPTPFPPWPPPVLGRTPPHCRSCRASVSSLKRSWGRGSLAR